MIGSILGEIVMNRLTISGATASLLVMGLCATLAFAEKIGGYGSFPGFDGPFTILIWGSGNTYLYALNGDLGFFTAAKRPADANAPRLPPYDRRGLPKFKVTDRTRLRLYAPYKTGDERTAKFLNSKDGWYLTADYSTDPPRVVLAKKRTKYSEWEFEITHHRPNGFDAYVKNKNAKGKFAWLAAAKKGIVYKVQQPDPQFHEDTGVRKAILSYKKTTAFFFLDTVADGG